MSSLDQFAQAKLDDLQRRHLRRALAETVREDGIWVERDGRRLLSFSCNDYLNLTQHPAIKQAAEAAIEQYGAGSGASRLVTGNHPLYAQLEARLARIKQTQAAVVFGSGYLANAGIIPVLIGRDGLVLVDELSHACLFAGAQLSHGTVITFRHNDVGHARELLSEHRAEHDHALIVTDGVFSMDGDLAPLAELLALANEHDAWLMSDDAHGLGVVGGGRGSSFAGNTHIPIPLQMGTLSKAVGAYGGYLCASEAGDRSDPQSRAHVDLFDRAAAIMRGRRHRRARHDRARAGLRRPAGAKGQGVHEAAGLPDAQSPIVPVIIGEEEATLAASRLLADEGYLAAAIRPPTVPAGTARLRLTFTAQHPDDQIARLAGLVRDKILT